MSMLLGTFFRVAVQEVMLASAVQVLVYGIALACPRTVAMIVLGWPVAEEVVLLSTLACPIVHFAM